MKSLFADKVFDIALGISLILHAIILAELPQARPRSRNLPRFVYRCEKQSRLPSPPKYVPPKNAENSKANLKHSHNNPSRQFASQLPPPGRAGKEIRPHLDEKMKKADLLSAENIDDELFKKMIEVQKVPADPKVRAFYLHYYDSIRAKIRDRAYRNYRRRLPGGDVFITFTLHRSGKLISAQVIREKSTANYELCEIALRSLQEAAPFDPFPEQLIHERLRFNVIISFKRR